MHQKIKVVADSSKEMMKKLPNGSLEIHVKEPASDNRANKRIMDIVRAMHKGRAVRMIKGHHSASKIVSIT
ncbi:MAG: DUF167 family protein [Candidatus Taylorbacteria bacterium]|nr:DUF167 family protein [Candidatus Taylorbacteria bacterium]